VGIKIDFFTNFAYVYIMKTMSVISAALIVASLSTPALACDRHGGGWGGHTALSGADWSTYDEYNTQQDFFPDAVKEVEAQSRAKKTYTPPAAKPSFSKASVRASDAAQAKLSAKARMAGKSDKDKDSAKTPAKAYPISDL